MRHPRHPLGIIFDLDGTLIDSEKLHEALYCEAAINLGQTLSRATYRSCFRGKTDREIFSGLSLAVQDPKILEAQIRWKQRSFLERLTQGEVFPVPGAVSYIHSLHTREIPLVLGTSALYAEADAALTHLALFDFFQGIVSAESTSQGKPAPEVYLKAAALLKLEPRNCLVYEDSVQGVAAAHAAGIPVIALGTDDTAALVRAGACQVIPDFRNHRLPMVGAVRPFRYCL